MHIVKGQDVPENQFLIVLSPTGDYEDEALIECARRDNPEVSYCAFQAQFIIEGSKVYSK